MVVYKKLSELFRLWRAGNTDICPANPKWKYRVEGDLLRSRGKVVGIPTSKCSPRGFFYRISHWRRWVKERAIIEALGGLPILDHEFEYKLGSTEATPGVEGMFRFIEWWVIRKGVHPPGEPSYHEIPGASAALGVTPDRELRVAREVRGMVRAVVVAHFLSDSEVGVLAQVGRSPAVNLAKDMVLVCISRSIGGRLPKGTRVVQLGGAGSPRYKVRGRDLPLAPTGSGLVNN